MNKNIVSEFNLFKKINKININCLDKDIAEIINQDTKNQLIENDFIVLKNIFNKNVLKDIKNFWLIPKKNYWSQSLFYGKNNFSYNFFNKYIRHFEFLWNKTSHYPTHDLTLVSHFIRNLIIDEDPNLGTVVNDNNEYIYTAITHYKANSGMMAAHSDPSNFINYHLVIPLTTKGNDYENGGLYIVKEKNKIDIESQLFLGDALLYKASLIHGVDLITGKKNQIGRMQFFPIPTKFEKKINIIKDVFFNIYGKYKYLRYKPSDYLKNHFR